MRNAPFIHAPCATRAHAEPHADSPIRRRTADDHLDAKSPKVTYARLVDGPPRRPERPPRPERPERPAARLRVAGGELK